MFLDITKKRNHGLIKVAFELHQKGLIQPDTYIIDLDNIIENGRKIKEEADKYGIKLYFMTKQFGRNPIVCHELMKLGYSGAVVVDFKEALTLKENGIKLGHVGHLVQIPTHCMEEIIEAKPEVVTVYSVDKAREVSKISQKLGQVQNIMLRVLDEGDTLYPAQYGGFYLNELIEKAKEIKELPNINIYGITSFPCFLFDPKEGDIKATKNIETLKQAQKLLEDKLNIKIQELNLPSATCVANIKSIAEYGGTHGEPGHGLTGTTPYHAENEAEEIPCLVYVSEVSHNLKEECYCYGGGHYRRSHMNKALVGSSIENYIELKAEEPSNESIDYYIALKGNANVGETVVMSYRTQVFVTRSSVAVVKGIKEGKPELLGIYDSLGKKTK
ncbi:YhfX family PLP-dependent enzyme [Clostridium sp. OS1-26]|uniref:YhfX family PLP-dependent enzyme n=1 Tax=Clostridium sp. OS1-26 TaxID=3070681 RepID=UPI0027DEBDF2|nr:YhfX family PLP-dependent enzyme [Clostridium sp. OS1-26]WML34924.1 YhfX family PLP-dependent enzyme [Clostridium sp. OS1-26]